MPTTAHIGKAFKLMKIAEHIGEVMKKMKCLQEFMEQLGELIKN